MATRMGGWAATQNKAMRTAFCLVKHEKRLNIFLFSDNVKHGQKLPCIFCLKTFFSDNAAALYVYFSFHT